MFGSLKYLRNISDEEVVATWLENPYWQYFCGEQYFCHDLPIDPSLMTSFRHRIGPVGCEFILGLTVQTGLATKTIRASSLAVVEVDTTVQDKAVAFPTDARLLNKARIALVKLGAKCGLNLRQPYTFIGQKAFVQSARYAHLLHGDRVVRAGWTRVCPPNLSHQPPRQVRRSALTRVKRHALQSTCGE